MCTFFGFILYAMVASMNGYTIYLFAVSPIKSMELIFLKIMLADIIIPVILRHYG